MCIVQKGEIQYQKNLMIKQSLVNDLTTNRVSLELQSVVFGIMC